MKRRLGFIAACTAAAMMITMLAGCGAEEKTTSDATKQTSAQQTTTAAPAPEKLKEISFATNNYFTDQSENPVGDAFCKAFEADTGIKLKLVSVPPDSYDDKISAMFASGTVADVVEGPTNMSPMIKQGFFQPLTDLIKKDSAMSALLDEKKTDFDAFTYSGQIYGVPSRVGWTQVIWARGDWLKKLNIAVPADLNSFVAMLKALKDSDLDGNGKKDTIPMTITNDIQMLDVFASYFGTKTQVYLDSATKKYVDPVLTPEFKNFLDFTKDLYSQGLIDKEMPTNSSYGKNREKFFTSKAASLIMWQQIYPGLYNGCVSNKSPDADPVPIPPFKGDKGVFGLSYFYPDEPFGISSTAKNADQILSSFFTWYFTSEKGIISSTLGVEGVSFNVVDGVATPTERGMGNPQPLKSSFKYPFKFPELTQKQYDYITKIVGWTNEHKDAAVKIEPNRDQTDSFAIQEDYFNQVSNLIFKYCMGEYDYNKLTSEYNTFKQQKNFDAIVAKMNQ
jgi:putative aldouronate transport system substrate-binding protein